MSGWEKESLKGRFHLSLSAFQQCLPSRSIQASNVQTFSLQMKRFVSLHEVLNGRRLTSHRVSVPWIVLKRQSQLLTGSFFFFTTQYWKRPIPIEKELFVVNVLMAISTSSELQYSNDSFFRSGSSSRSI